MININNFIVNSYKLLMIYKNPSYTHVFTLSFFPLWLGVYLTILYKLPSHSRKRFKYFIRTWVVFFALEMVTILFLPDEQMDYLGLQKGERFTYWVIFTKSFYELITKVLLKGYGKEFWMLVLVAILAYLTAFWVGYRKEQAHTP